VYAANYVRVYRYAYALTVRQNEMIYSQCKHLQSWRMTVLEEYLTRQRHTIHTALTGTADSTEALAIIGTLSIKGIGQIKHQALTYEHQALISITYTDTGSYTKISTTLWANGTALLMQTQSRMYMVSKQFMRGTALSTQEVRVVAPIQEECALVIHTQHGRYEVIQAGKLNCWERSVGYTEFVLKKGETLHVEDKEYCNNDCIQLGHKGYMTKEKHMPNQPTVHPADMRQFKQETFQGDQTSAHRDKVVDDGHQRIHDKMAQDIRDSEDIIQEIRDDRDTKTDYGVHFGVAGVVVSVLTVLSLLLICARCGWKRCRASWGAQGGGTTTTHTQVPPSSD